MWPKVGSGIRGDGTPHLLWQTYYSGLQRKCHFSKLYQQISMHLWLAGLPRQVICQRPKPCHFPEKNDRERQPGWQDLCLVFGVGAKHLLLEDALGVCTSFLTHSSS